MREGRSIGLEEIVSNFKNLIFDTSSLRGYFRKSSFDFRYKKGTEKVFEDNRELYKRILEYLDKDKHIFITEKVLDEVSKIFKYKYSKTIKNLKRIQNQIPDYREQLQYHRKLKGFIKDIRKLIRSFETNLNVLNLNKDQEEIYETLWDSYEHLQENYKLSYTDYDLLLSNIILAGTNGSCALISNDIPMAKVWGNIILDLNISNSDAGFFIRREGLKFRKFYLNLNS